jgi:hypothetical protein
LWTFSVAALAVVALVTFAVGTPDARGRGRAIANAVLLLVVGGVAVAFVLTRREAEPGDGVRAAVGTLLVLPLSIFSLRIFIRPWGNR